MLAWKTCWIESIVVYVLQWMEIAIIYLLGDTYQRENDDNRSNNLKIHHSASFFFVQIKEIQHYTFARVKCEAWRGLLLILVNKVIRQSNPSRGSGVAVQVTAHNVVCRLSFVRLFVCSFTFVRADDRWQMTDDRWTILGIKWRRGSQWNVLWLRICPRVSIPILESTINLLGNRWVPSASTIRS